MGFIDEVITLANKKIEKLQKIGLTMYEKMKVDEDVTKKVNRFSLLAFKNALNILKAFEPLQKRNILDNYLQFVELVQEHFGDEIQLRFEQDRVYIKVVASDREIKLEKLSSGQQHMLTLMYHLCFKIQSECIVFIDEPEISLNIGWQERLPTTLLTIAEKKRAQFILSTHSPYVFGEHFGSYGVEFKKRTSPQ